MAIWCVFMCAPARGKPAGSQRFGWGGGRARAAASGAPVAGGGAPGGAGWWRPDGRAQPANDNDAPSRWHLMAAGPLPAGRLVAPPTSGRPAGALIRLACANIILLARLGRAKPAHNDERVSVCARQTGRPAARLPGCPANWPAQLDLVVAIVSRASRVLARLASRLLISAYLAGKAAGGPEWTHWLARARARRSINQRSAPARRPASGASGARCP